MNGYSSETALATSVESRPLDKQLEQLAVTAEQAPTPGDGAVPAEHHHDENNNSVTDTEPTTAD